MNITFKLFASLTDYLPTHARYTNQIPLEVSDKATISEVIEPFSMPEKLVHLVLVNGKYISPELRLTQTLQEGDVLDRKSVV